VIREGRERELKWRRLRPVGGLNASPSYNPPRDCNISSFYWYNQVISVDLVFGCIRYIRWYLAFNASHATRRVGTKRDAGSKLFVYMLLVFSLYNFYLVFVDIHSLLQQESCWLILHYDISVNQKWATVDSGEGGGGGSKVLFF